LTIFVWHPPEQTGHNGSDLDNTVADDGNLKGRRANVVRMFRRLLRGGAKQHVTGYWVW